MPTLADAAGPDGLRGVPRIDRADVRLLWHAGYWDGPRSGMLVHGGEECWFEVVDEGEADDGPRRLAIVRLTPGQLAEERRWHELFRRCVGEHTDYDASGQRPVGAVHPRERWPEFYEAYRLRTPRDFTGNEVVGWFEA